MTCEEARERFSALMDGALDAGEGAALAVHLEECPECARELERFRRTVGLLHAVEPARAPDGFAERVVTAVRTAPAPGSRRRAAPRRFWFPLQAAAAVLVAVGALYVWEAQMGGVQQVTRPRESFRLSRDARESPAAKAPAARPPEPAVGGLRKEAPEAGEGAKSIASETPARERADVATESKPSPSTPGAAGRLARDVAQEKEAAVAAPEARAKRGAGLAPPVDVVGRLAASDRAAAGRGLADLVARTGGVVLGRTVDAGGETLELTVPRAAYPEFVGALAELGRWVVEREVAEPGPEVRVTVRITD